MADEMSVTLPEGVLRPIIQAQVVAALQGQDRLLSEMVGFILNQKVRDQSTYKDYPFVEFISRQLLKEAVEAAVREWLASKKEAIKAAVETALRGQVRNIATRLVAGVAGEADNKWRLSIGVSVKE